MPTIKKGYNKYRIFSTFVGRGVTKLFFFKIIINIDSLLQVSLKIIYSPLHWFPWSPLLFKIHLWPLSFSRPARKIHILPKTISVNSYNENNSNILPSCMRWGEEKGMKHEDSKERATVPKRKRMTITLLLVCITFTQCLTNPRIFKLFNFKWVKLLQKGKKQVLRNSWK